MIAVDTHVLVRLFINDDDRQHELATRFFRARTSESPVFVSMIVAAEFVWVLARVYRLPKQAILGLLKTITDTVDVVLENRDNVIHVLALATDDKGEFPDLLIASLGEAAGADCTVTFDRKAAKKIPTMKLLA